MDDNIFLLLGGIGMFLLGMEIMTAALKDSAGSNLRNLLAGFTTTPARGVATGTMSTMIIQSSSATTVMTVGFVGAGLISMTQALGILYGANIGTTATGWLVSILGFKLKLGTVAMVGLFPAAMADLLGRGAVARVGRVLAGLFLLLIGLELMQTGMSEVSDVITPDLLPGPTFLGFLALAGIGVGITILMQSSSAAMALALVMLQAGSISLTQAGMIVIGMNIGTTFTAILASLGGSRSMRQTALANLLFNIVTSLIAFPLLILGRGALGDLADATDEITALLVFHTGFNLVGTALFLPATPAFARLIERLIPDHRPAALITLDRVLLKDPHSALLAAQTAAWDIGCHLFDALGLGLQRVPDYRGLATVGACDEAIEELRGFVSDIRLPDDRPQEEAIYSALLFQIDHLLRLSARAHQTGHIEPLLEDRMLRRPALAVGASLARLSVEPVSDQDMMRPHRLYKIVSHRRHQHRRSLLLAEHAGIYSVTEVFAHTDAMRWLDRMLHHVDRMIHYHQVAAKGLPAAGTTAADRID